LRRPGLSICEVVAPEEEEEETLNWRQKIEKLMLLYSSQHTVNYK
jgi:hypothetical protein